MRFAIYPQHLNMFWLRSPRRQWSSRSRSAAVAATVLLALAGAGGLAASAQAANYTVGTHEDLTGTCPSPAAGTCSLRQLIEYEDSLEPKKEAVDAIIVPAGQYSLSHGPLLITQTLVIIGAGARTTNVDVPAGITAQ